MKYYSKIDKYLVAVIIADKKLPAIAAKHFFYASQSFQLTSRFANF
jgi:hypothetical protein